MSIKNRKSPVIHLPATVTDARAIGLVLAALPGLAFAAQPEAATGGSGERVLRGVVVVEEAEDSYKAEEASSPKFTAPLLDTPQTITVLKKELLEDQAAGSLANARAELTPLGVMLWSLDVVNRLLIPARVVPEPLAEVSTCHSCGVPPTPFSKLSNNK